VIHLAKGEGMLSKPAVHWEAIEADPRFQALHRDKMRFLILMLLFALGFFFSLPISAAYFQSWMQIKIWGVINLALIFALAQFLVAWGIAFMYARRATREFDARARAIVADLRNAQHTTQNQET
jgi:uncharacterized membrane protein (DUF485 family)